jgi:DNA-binding response OmpR family regulator
MSTTILLVDDSPLVAEAMREVLVSAGFRVINAPDGRHALSALAMEPVDAGIVDMQLRGESGVALLHRFRELHPGLKTILMSGSFDEGEPVPRQLENVADALLAKPIDSGALCATLRRLLE